MGQDICPKCKRPGVHRLQGFVRPDTSGGFEVVRFGHDESFYGRLASKREAFKLLWALTHGWSHVTVAFVSGVSRTINLQQYWSRAVHHEKPFQVVVKRRT